MAAEAAAKERAIERQAAMERAQAEAIEAAQAKTKAMAAERHGDRPSLREAEEEFDVGMRQNAMEWDAADIDRNRVLDFEEFSALVREREVSDGTLHRAVSASSSSPSPSLPLSLSLSLCVCVTLPSSRRSCARER